MHTVATELKEITERAPAAALRIVRLSAERAARWDELIAPFESRELFHRSVWLEYLEVVVGAKPVRCELKRGDQTVGYFAAGEIRKGPFRILGSPLKGWGTNFMGPIVEGALDQAEFLRALDNFARAEGYSMLEIESRGLVEQAMSDAGYEPVTGKSYLIRLTPEDPQRTWQAVESTCRNRVRKGTKNGLVVEDSDDPHVVDEFYGFYMGLLAHKRKPVPYEIERARTLFRMLKRNDMLFAVRVKNKEGQVLAAGMFPHDDRHMYFWGGASSLQQRELCPNEFMHWSAIEMGLRRGLVLYDMCGYGQFKKKFGGELTMLHRWHKCYSPSARLARRVYKRYYELRGALQLRLRALGDHDNSNEGGAE